jgi:hypothetical protein
VSDSTAGPVFITGLDRSGKTRLRRFLATSPALSLTRRAELWTRPHRHNHRFDDTTPAVPDCLRALLLRPAVAEMVVDADAILRELGRGAPTHARLFALVHEQHAARSGATRWGEQDSQIERIGHGLLTQLPTARVIHLVADPVERLRALDRPWHRRLGLAGAATAAWVASVRRASDLATRHPGRYRPVTTASLGDVERVREILRFLGISDIAPVALGDRKMMDSTGPDRAFVVAVAHPELHWTGYAPSDGTRAAGRRSALQLARWGPAWVRFRATMRSEDAPRLVFEGEAWR